MPKSRQKPRRPQSSPAALAPRVLRAPVRANWRDAAVLAGLLLLIAVAFWPVARNDFISYDDSDYVVENDYVNGGITLHGICTAFAAPRAANWHPLTWISHMLDCQLFGLRPAGHHLTSLAIHASNSVLLYAILLRMTAAAWPSAAVAALFAVHPLHVESVAWVAERKDVLSTLFGLAAIWAWLGYVARPRVWRYLAVMLFYSASLMSKSMLVTLPCLLLLLDWWPLRRVLAEGDDLPRVPFAILLLEKLPLALMSAASCLKTVMTQSSGHAVVPLEEFGVLPRLATIALAYCGYLQKLSFPVDLAPIYPLSKAPNYWAAMACANLLAVATFLLLWGGALAFGSRRKYLAVGWLWYIGLLVPVIGLVQVGQQSMADRYTYLPIVGIFILLAWAAADLVARWRWLKPAVVVISAVALAACCLLSNAQVRLWASTKTLFAHTVAVTQGNPVALTNLGLVAMQEGRYEDSERYLRAALQLDANELDTWGNVANLYRKQKKYADALKAFAKVEKLCPGNSKCYCQIAETLRESGNLAGAESYYQLAVNTEPANPRFLRDLAVTRQSQGKYREALESYGRLLELDSGNPGARNNIAWIYATSPDASVRNGAKAIELLESEGQKPACVANLLDTLAAAYAEAGQFDHAVETATRAIGTARSEGVAAGEIAAMEKRLELYKKRQPYRER